MFIVTGATGNTGSVVAASLLDSGKDVTLLVRSAKKAAPWKSRGAKIVEANLQDAKALAGAFRGASGAYLMLPPAYEVEDYLSHHAAVARTYAEAAQEAHLPHAVFLSSWGAQHNGGTGPIRALAAAEKILAGIPILTVLRASWFLENFVPGLSTARAEGVLNGFLAPSVTVPMIATRDIGAVAAELLLQPPAKSSLVEITGPEDYTMDAIATVLSEAMDRPVRYQAAPPEAAVAVFQQMGLSRAASEMMAELFEAVNKGLTSAVGTPRRMGISAREFFSTYAANAAAAH
jgi:uncharacterized protein YbjT (DUF2867 family)